MRAQQPVSSQSILFAVFAAALSLALAAHAEADKVTLIKNNEVLSGKITKDERDGLEIEMREKGGASGARRTLNSNEIKDVDWDLADQDAADGLRSFKQGAYGQAAETLGGIVGQKETLERMRPVARPFLVYAFAESLMRSGRAKDAYPVYQSLTENYKTSRYAPMALTSMASAAVQAKAFDKLPALLAQLRDAGGEQKQRADLLEAEALLMQGKAKEALSRYSSAAAGSTGAVKALALAGQARAYAESGDLPKAREAALAALAANPTPELAADAHAIVGDAIMAEIDAKKTSGAALQDALLDAALEYLRVQNQYAARSDTEGRALLKAGECFQKLSTLPTRAGSDDRERALALYGKLSSDRRFANSDYANKAFKHSEEMKPN